MKLQIFSDTHAEHFNDDLARLVTLDPQADVIIAAGDIGTYALHARLNDPRIIKVIGNHEMYRRGLPGWAVNFIRRVDDVKFVCTPLWSYIPDQFSEAVAASLTDFKIIPHWDIAEHNKMHQECLVFLKRNLRVTRQEFKTGISRVCVVTHWAPSYRSVAPMFVGSNLNCAFASDLEELIAEYSPLMWIHGHMHLPADYMIGNTRVIANPYGYSYRVRENPDFTTALFEL